jgi:hypothetical protein
MSRSPRSSPPLKQAPLPVENREALLVERPFSVQPTVLGGYNTVRYNLTTYSHQYQLHIL